MNQFERGKERPKTMEKIEKKERKRRPRDKIKFEQDQTKIKGILY
jgi:hypothetical protein